MSRDKQITCRFESLWPSDAVTITRFSHTIGLEIPKPGSAVFQDRSMMGGQSPAKCSRCRSHSTDEPELWDNRTMKLRQIALVAGSLEPIVTDLAEIFGLGEPFADKGATTPTTSRWPSARKYRSSTS